MHSIARPVALIALTAAVLSAAPIAAHAQSTRTNFNIAGGLSLASDSFGDRNDAGYHLIAGVGATPAGSPLGFRAEGMFNQFNEKITDETSHAIGFTVNAVYDLMPATASRRSTLYAIGGVGYYNTREPFLDHNQDQGNYGWNLGGGFRFPMSGFSAYVEARYHAVQNVDVKFAPFTFGLVF